MKVVRIVVNDTCFFQINTPEEFNYAEFLREVRERGYFFDGQCVYIPYAKIQNIIYMDPALISAAQESQLPGATRQ